MDDAALVTNERKSLATLEMLVFIVLLVLMLLLAGQVGQLAATSPSEAAVTQASDENALPYCYSECGFMR